MRLWRVKFSKFPVIFPVSREFGQRRVSVRLRAPPDSLDCRETALNYGKKTRDMPVFRVDPLVEDGFHQFSVIFHHRALASPNGLTLNPRETPAQRLDSVLSHFLHYAAFSQRLHHTVRIEDVFRDP